MANNMTSALAGDNLDKAASEINKMGIKGVSAKVSKRKKFTKKQLEAIKKAREQLKSLREGGQ